MDSEAGGAPTISILTPCLNRAQYVATAIRSVLDQDYPRFEHLIMDAGSTDGTLEILAQYPHLRMISEPDEGMYEALNKGLSLAKGEIIGFLNTDDHYTKGAFEVAARGLAKASSSLVVGQAELLEDTGQTLVRRLDNPLLDNLLGQAILGEPRMNAFFFRREVFQAVGRFDTSFKLAADRDFLMRIALAGLRGTEVKEVLYCYRAHRGSMTFDVDHRKGRAMVDEHLRWAEKYLRQPAFPTQAANYMSQLYVRVSIEGCGRALLTGDVAGASRYARAGVRHDAFWVFRFLRYAVLFLVLRPPGTPFVMSS